MRAGHIRLDAHMYSKFKVGESEKPPRNADIMTAEHLLQHCQLNDALRRDIVARGDTTEGQALWQPGGAEEDSHFREANRHLRLAYDDDEATRGVTVSTSAFLACVNAIVRVRVSLGA